ncbi:hypothetical protein LUZ60_001466 [Juncus effusus]|nr:hypothetical protein LUZ60_001466 [Juncus effusus]
MNESTEQEKEEEEERGEIWGWSWGAGTDGQLGTVIFEDRYVPQRLISSPPLSISHVACGGAHSIALTHDGSVYTWGRGSNGQLGHGDLENCSKPKHVNFFENLRISRVSAGWNHSGFVTDTGRLFMCGDGSFGQLGTGDLQSYNIPIEVQFFESKHVKEIACGMRHSLVLINGNFVYGFGSCRHGQIGKPASGAQRFCTNPEIIQGFENCRVTNLFANGDHSAALTDNRELYIWGRGFNKAQNDFHPRVVQTSLKISQVALGWHHALILSEGEVYMLGAYRHANLNGSKSIPSTSTNCLEESTTRPELEKILILEGEKVIQIASGSEHSAVLTDKGKIMTWGWGEHGQLGLGDICDQTFPQIVKLEKEAPFVDPLAIHCGSGFTLVTSLC